MLLHFLFEFVVDVVTELVRDGVLIELLYADDFVLMSVSMKIIRNNLLEWKHSFEDKALKVNLCKTKVMITGGITRDGLSKSKVNSCGVCSLRVMANSFFCVQCGKWFDGRCSGMKWVTVSVSGNCERNIIIIFISRLNTQFHFMLLHLCTL